MSIRYPLALGKLAGLILKLIALCPREAISLIGNLHTIGFFAKHLDRGAISHIHAYFLSWPASIGMALSVVTGRHLSISAHARDIFVEHGATELKVSHAKFVRTCTKQGLKHLKATLPAKYHYKMNLIYHGTKTASICPDVHEKMPECKPNNTLITVGRMIQKKGIGTLLRAFALVLEENTNCSLMIVGDGPGRKQLNRLVRQLGIESHVEFLGWQEHNITLRLITKAAILVVPSVIADDGDRDGIPNVILEAFSHGTPVVASSLGGISEIVEHRRTGLLVKPGDVMELASAIKEFLNSKDLQRHLSQMAYEVAIKRFDSMKNVKRLSHLFISTN